MCAVEKVELPILFLLIFEKKEMQNFLRQLLRAAQQSARQGGPNGPNGFGATGGAPPSGGVIIGVGAAVAALFAGSAAIYNVNGKTRKKKNIFVCVC